MATALVVAAVTIAAHVTTTTPRRATMRAVPVVTTETTVPVGPSRNERNST
jgi:hypothetical protein